MPYKWETIEKMKMPKELDRRRKLTDAERNNIKHLHFDLNWQIRKIARKYEKRCSRRLIHFILFPERLERTKEIHKARQWWKHYSTEYKTRKIREHRRYKQKVLQRSVNNKITKKCVK